MFKKNVSISLIVIVIFVSALFVIKQWRRGAQGQTMTIGILTTIPHPALDSAQNGFIQAMTERFGNTVRFIMQSADGSAAQAQSIANAFHTNTSVKGILTLGSLATQAMARVEKSKPIFIAAVSDPSGLGLDQQENVCGSSDSINLQDYMATFKTLLLDVRVIALLFNPAEINAVGMIEKMIPLFEQAQMTVVKAPIQHESEIGQTMNFALSRADAVVAPIDNTVASLIEAIARQASNAQKPLIVADALLVSKGAFAALSGVDYGLSGKAAAKMAINVLVDGIVPQKLGFVQSPSKKLVVNKTVLQELKRSVPAVLADVCEFVE